MISIILRFMKLRRKTGFRVLKTLLAVCSPSQTNIACFGSARQKDTQVEDLFLPKTVYKVEFN